MNKLTMVLVGVVCLLAGVAQAQRGELEIKKFNLENGPSKASVVLRKSSRTVDVYVKDQSIKDMPKSIGISIHVGQDKTVDLELQAMKAENQTWHYHGLMPSNPQSFMGVEVSIPFGKGETKKFQSDAAKTP